MHNLHTLLNLLGYERSQYMSKEERDALIRQCVIARTMDQLRATMPDAPPRPVFVKHSLPFLTEDEREFYTGIQGLLTKRFRALEDERKNGFERFRLLMRLRQLSLHPQIYIGARKKVLGRAYNRPDWTGTSTKFETIRELLSASAGEPHKWIIFCHFHGEMEMLQTSLRALPFVRHVGIYSGAENAGQREKVLAESREPLLAGATADVLLVQLQAGGVGLNLQHCDRIIFTGPWWTSALMEQAVGRAVRIGQRAVVEVHHLILKEEEGMNIDHVIMKKAVAKGEMCRDVLKAAFTDVV
jgi:SNF2 family DNA or RNA helicase